jgi:hypothetical protein
MPKPPGDPFPFDTVRHLPPGAIFDVVRYIETRQEIQEACELLRGCLALTNDGRIPATVHARHLLRALWTAMEKVGGRALPLWPKLLNKDVYHVRLQKAAHSRNPEQFYREARRQVLAAIDDVVRWCDPAPKMLLSGSKKPKDWCAIFDLSWDTLKIAFDEQTIRNVQLGQRSYRVAIEDIPAKHQAKFLGR